MVRSWPILLGCWTEGPTDVTSQMMTWIQLTGGAVFMRPGPQGEPFAPAQRPPPRIETPRPVYYPRSQGVTSRVASCCPSEDTHEISPFPGLVKTSWAATPLYCPLPIQNKT